MKWGLFIISLGCLIICLAGSPETSTSLGMVVSGAILVAVGFFFIFASKKMKQRKETREKIDREQAEFAAQQARKREEAGRKKQLENVEKSRKNSQKNEENKN